MSNLIACIERTVGRDKERVALSWKDNGQYRSISYGEFWDRLQAFAFALQELGIKQDSKVAILSNNCLAWTIADLGIMMCGAVTVPVYQTLTPQQIAYNLQNADVEAIIVENADFAAKVQSVATEMLHSIIVINPAGLDLKAGLFAFDELMERGASLLAENGPQTLWRDLPDTALATIVHTSGTTGNPKGVMLTHRNLVENARATLDYVPVSPDDRTLSYLPLSHIFERTCGQNCVLMSGASITYAESLAVITTNLLEVRPTLMTSVPRLFEKIHDAVLKNIHESSKFKQWIFHTALSVGRKHIQQPTAMTRLFQPLFDKLVFAQIRARMGGNIRLLISGGAPLSPAIGEFLEIAGLYVCEGYGMTETSPVVSTNPSHDLRVGTVGKPLANLQIKFAADGELLVKGPSIMTGYYNNPEATAEAFDEEGYLRTGDIAELVDGYLKIVERKKNILVLATGKNVAPFPVESALARSPFISQAVLFGDKRKYVTAMIVPDFEVLENWAKEHGLPQQIEELVAHPKVRELYDRELQHRLQEFASFERPKKYTLLTHDLTSESGELTVTLKVRTHVLLSRYGEAIEAMYADEKQSQMSAS